MTDFNIPHSPVAVTGKVVLWVAFIIAGYAAAAGIVGNAQKRRRLVDSSIYALYGFFALMMLATALIIYAFVTHDFAIKYVAKYSDTTMPLHYKITAYWGGLDGSLMFWVSVLALFSSIAVWSNRKRHRDMIGYVVGIIMVVQLFFLALLIYTKNPFTTFLVDAPTDGEGLNPLLQNYWMVIHPPALYTGFVAATIPFAFGMAALASGRLDDRWMASVRVWTVICWFFLSFGLILGGRWAYEELGWGGYWAWDPVENAGLLPWFTMTAFLHTVIIQEQRGMMKVWNLVLVVTSFFLTIFGTFMTRSGVVQSVHAFGEDAQLALLFILFLTLILIVSFGLLIWRLPKLRSSNTFESFFSREFAFLLNNWVLLGCAVFVLFATMFPTISEAIDGQRITVGPEFFNKWMTPLGLILLFLAGAAPLLAYRRTTKQRLFRQFVIPLSAMVWTIALVALVFPVTRTRTAIFAQSIKLPIALVNFGLIAFTFASVGQEFVRGIMVRRRQTGSDPFTSLAGLLLFKRRKYGGYIIHLAIGMMFFGFAGKAWDRMEDFTVTKQGETFHVEDYVFEYKRIWRDVNDHRTAWIAELGLYEAKKKKDVTGKTRYVKGAYIDTLRPERRRYVKSDGQPTTEVDMSNHLDEDVYMVLTGFEGLDDRENKNAVVNVRVYINPLINWVWLGFGLLILGTVLILIPQRVVDSLSPRRRSRAGRFTEAALILLAAGGVTFGLVNMARAQSPPGSGALEHNDGAASHGSGVGFAHICRPDSDVAKKAMKELVCLCGGCQRESIYECKCEFAKNERCRVLNLLKQQSLDSQAARDKAYQDVLDSFVAQYGEHVLATPKSKLSWSIPLVAIGGGLLLLFGVGRLWVRKGRNQVAATAAVPAEPSLEDEDYADILDDELRDTD